MQNALNCETEFSVCFQQVDAVLRASTSIVNSAKLKKLFKVKIFSQSYKLKQIFARIHFMKKSLQLILLLVWAGLFKAGLR